MQILYRAVRASWSSGWMAPAVLVTDAVAPLLPAHLQVVMQYAYYVGLAENYRVYMGPSKDLEVKDRSPYLQEMVGVLGVLCRRLSWPARSEHHATSAYDEEGGAYLVGVAVATDYSF